MGLAILCDGCGVDIAQADRANISMQSIEGGTVQVDLCWDCASPLRRIPAVMDECRKRRDSILSQRAVLVPEMENPPDLTSVSVYPELEEEDAKTEAAAE